METIFFLICGFLALIVLLLAAALRREAWILVITFGGIDLLLQAILADKGFFSDFSVMPPRIAVALLPNIFLLCFFAFRGGIGTRLSQIPPYWLVGFQTFRVLMEYVLYSLVQDKQLPEIMTFTGSNFDILVGITAPFVAILLMQPDRFKLQLAVLWNGVSFLILLNTVVHGLFSTPTPFQIFQTDPANTLIAEFPWIWLPGFVVPCAFLGHILSIRQLRATARSLA